MFGMKDIGIDLGTANILIYVKGKGIVIQEPSVVALDTKTGKVLSVGEEARKMIGKTPGTIKAIRPLRKGVISDYTATEKMLKYFISKAIGKKSIFFKPRIAVCVPSGVTEVEKRAVKEAVKQVGARAVAIIEEPIAAAIGAGIDIAKAKGSMVIDIGGGTTDVAVISLGGVVISKSIKVAGDNFDNAIVRYMRKKHNMLIGDKSAEILKKGVGSAFEKESEISMEIKGRNLVSGLPKRMEITSKEMREALSDPLDNIIEAVHYVLEKTPPELSSDISDRGIIMTGGGSLLNGLDKLIESRTGIKVIRAEDTMSCVAYGTGKYVEICDWRNLK